MSIAPDYAATIKATQRRGSGLERRPHLLVALRRPDARVAIVRRLVIGARDIERHAVIENDPIAVFRLQSIVRFAVDAAQVLAGRCRGFDRRKQLAYERTRRCETLLHLLFAQERGATAGHELRGPQ